MPWKLVFCGLFLYLLPERYRPSLRHTRKIPPSERVDVTATVTVKLRSDHILFETSERQVVIELNLSRSFVSEQTHTRTERQADRQTDR